MKKKIMKVLLAVASLVLISFIFTLILAIFGIIEFEDGINLNIELFKNFASSWYGCLIILVIEVIITTLLSFIPGTSMAFILLWKSLINNSFFAFTLAFSGVLLSSLMMYLLGRIGGYKLCVKILGNEECQKASHLLNKKGKTYFPIMMMLPIFPDDALVMIAGSFKMEVKWFVPSIILGRGVGIATIIFGLDIIPFDKFTSIWHWILFAVVAIVGVILLFVLANKVNKLIEEKNNKE